MFLQHPGLLSEIAWDPISRITHGDQVQESGQVGDWRILVIVDIGSHQGISWNKQIEYAQIHWVPYPNQHDVSPTQEGNTHRFQVPPKGGQSKFYMFSYLLDAIFAHNALCGMSWTWTPWEPVVYVYCKFLLKWNQQRSNGESNWRLPHSIGHVDLWGRAILNVTWGNGSSVKDSGLVWLTEWHFPQGVRWIEVSTYFTKVATNNSAMQEVVYHPSTWLSANFHRKNKAPWPTLPMKIGLCEIKNLKFMDTKGKEI